MEYQILSWATEKLEPDQTKDLLTLLAKIEARARLETIRQFLELLYRAKQGKLDVESLTSVVQEWYMDVEGLVDLQYNDPFFTNSWRILNRKIGMNKVRHEDKMKLPEKLGEMMT